MFEVFEEAAKVKIAFDPTKTVGSSAPFGFFDPAAFCLDISEDQVLILMLILLCGLYVIIL
jgi:hypothetical protein